MIDDRADLSRRGRHTSVRTTNRLAVRKLIRNGSSLACTIPPEWLDAMHLLPGDAMELIYDHEWNGVFVRALHPRTFRPSIVPPASA